MKANKVIERLDAIRPNSYSEEQKLEWINNLEEMVQRLVMQSNEIKSLSYPEDMDKELLITAPFDNLYGLYLESMIDYYNREYGYYNNSALMFETRFTEYKKAYIRGDSITSYSTEEKTVTPTKEKQEVTPTDAHYLKKVTVNPIPDEYVVPKNNKYIYQNGRNIDVTEYASVTVSVPVVDATLTEKTIKANGTYKASTYNADGFSKVVVDVSGDVPEYQNKTVTENGTYTADEGFDAMDSVTVNVQPKLQEKTVYPSTSARVIKPDMGFDGLSKVEVSAIRLQEKTITKNGEIIPDNGYDGLSKVIVNVAGEAVEEYDGSGMVIEEIPYITFYYEYRDSSGELHIATLTCESGTSWISFVGSDADTLGFYLDSGGVLDHQGNSVAYSGNPVSDSDTIIAEGTYTTY